MAEAACYSGENHGGFSPAIKYGATDLFQHLRRWSFYQKRDLPIHLIPKWRAINYSLVCMLISPLRLVNMYKKQKNFEVKMRQRGLINMQTKE